MTSKWLPLTHTELLRWKAQQVRVAQDSYEVDKEETTMTSKEALNEMSNYIGRLGGAETLEEEEIILKDLEVLEMLKKHLYIEVQNQWKDGTYPIIIDGKGLEYNDYTYMFVNAEEYQKIKEWLENDK